MLCIKLASHPCMCKAPAPGHARIFQLLWPTPQICSELIVHMQAACFTVFQLPRPTPERPYVQGLLDPCTNCMAAPNIPAEVLYDKQARPDWGVPSHLSVTRRFYTRGLILCFVFSNENCMWHTRSFVGHSCPSSKHATLQKVLLSCQLHAADERPAPVQLMGGVPHAAEPRLQGGGAVALREPRHRRGGE